MATVSQQRVEQAKHHMLTRMALAQACSCGIPAAALVLQSAHNAQQALSAPGCRCSPRPRRSGRRQQSQR